MFFFISFEEEVTSTVQGEGLPEGIEVDKKCDKPPLFVSFFVKGGRNGTYCVQMEISGKPYTEYPPWPRGGVFFMPA